MIYLPSSPAIGGTMLAAYIAAEPHRQAISNQIVARLEPAGRVGPHARYYIVQRPERRAVFRGILLSLGSKLPEWSKDNHRASQRNRAFMDRHRDAYIASRQAAAATSGASHVG